MRAVPISFYMAPWCPYCREAKRWLKEGGYRVEEHNIEDDAQASAHLLMVNPRGSIPMFEIGGRRVIGFAPEMVRALLRGAVMNGA